MKMYELEVKDSIRDGSGLVSAYVAMDIHGIKPISHKRNIERSSFIFKVMTTDETIEKAKNESFLQYYYLGKKEIKE